MSVDDSGLEVLRKSAVEITPGDPSEYKLRVDASVSLGDVTLSPTGLATDTKQDEQTALLTTIAGASGGVNYKTRGDDFTGTGAGTVLNASATPVKSFGIQVSKDGAVTSWTVELQVSLDNVNYEALLTHTNVTPGDGKIQWTGSQMAPALYFKSVCTALVLGAGTKITSTILGIS